jgi:hypothetical protein
MWMHLLRTRLSLHVNVLCQYHRVPTIIRIDASGSQPPNHGPCFTLRSRNVGKHVRVVRQSQEALLGKAAEVAAMDLGQCFEPGTCGLVMFVGYKRHRQPDVDIKKGTCLPGGNWYFSLM